MGVHSANCCCTTCGICGDSFHLRTAGTDIVTGQPVGCDWDESVGDASIVTSGASKRLLLPQGASVTNVECSRVYLKVFPSASGNVLKITIGNVWAKFTWGRQDTSDGPNSRGTIEIGGTDCANPGTARNVALFYVDPDWLTQIGGVADSSYSEVWLCVGQYQNGAMIKAVGTTAMLYYESYGFSGEDQMGNAGMYTASESETVDPAMTNPYGIATIEAVTGDFQIASADFQNTNNRDDLPTCTTCWPTCWPARDQFKRANDSDINVGALNDWGILTGDASISSNSCLITTDGTFLVHEYTRRWDMMRAHVKMKFGAAGDAGRIIISRVDANNYIYAELLCGTPGGISCVSVVGGSPTEVMAVEFDVATATWYEVQFGQANYHGTAVTTMPFGIYIKELNRRYNFIAPYTGGSALRTFALEASVSSSVAFKEFLGGGIAAAPQPGDNPGIPAEYNYRPGCGGLYCTSSNFIFGGMVSRGFSHVSQGGVNPVTNTTNTDLDHYGFPSAAYSRFPGEVTELGTGWVIGKDATSAFPFASVTAASAELTYEVPVPHDSFIITTNAKRILFNHQGTGDYFWGEYGRIGDGGTVELDANDPEEDPPAAGPLSLVWDNDNDRVWVSGGITHSQYWFTAELGPLTSRVWGIGSGDQTEQMKVGYMTTDSADFGCSVSKPRCVNCWSGDSPNTVQIEFNCFQRTLDLSETGLFASNYGGDYQDCSDATCDQFNQIYTLDLFAGRPSFVPFVNVNTQGMVRDDGTKVMGFECVYKAELPAPFCEPDDDADPETTDSPEEADRLLYIKAKCTTTYVPDLDNPGHYKPSGESWIVWFDKDEWQLEPGTSVVQWTSPAVAPENASCEDCIELTSSIGASYSNLGNTVSYSWGHCDTPYTVAYLGTNCTPGTCRVGVTTTTTTSTTTTSTTTTSTTTTTTTTTCGTNRALYIWSEGLSEWLPDGGPTNCDPCFLGGNPNSFGTGSSNGETLCVDCCTVEGGPQDCTFLIDSSGCPGGDAIWFGETQNDVRIYDCGTLHCPFDGPVDLTCPTVEFSQGDPIPCSDPRVQFNEEAGFGYLFVTHCSVPYEDPECSPNQSPQ